VFPHSKQPAGRISFFVSWLPLYPHTRLSSAVTLDHLQSAVHTLRRRTRPHSSLVVANIVDHALSPVASVSARQSARYAAAHSTTSPDKPILPVTSLQESTYALLLSPMMIKSNLSPPPTFPATFWDLVPFLCAGGLALIFTALLVLLVEDDPNDSKGVGEQQSQLATHQRRFVGLSEKEREWSTRLHSSYYGYSPVQKNVTGSPASATVAPKTIHHQRPVFPKRLFGVYFPSC